MNLPPELIFIIAKYLSPKDLLAFRNTCKEIRNIINPVKFTFANFLNPPDMWDLNKFHSASQLKKYNDNIKQYIQYLVQNHSILNSYITSNLDGGYSMISEYYPTVDYKMCKDSLWNVTFNRGTSITRTGKTCIQTKLQYVYSKLRIDLDVRKIYHPGQWEFQIQICLNGPTPINELVVGRTPRTIIRRLFRKLRYTCLDDFIPFDFEKEEDESYFIIESKKLMNDVTFPLWPLFHLIHPQ